MGFLATLIGGAAERDEATGFKSGGRLAYDPRLIHHLKADHRELVNAFSALKRAASECRFQELPALLLSLKQSLQTHILRENAKLYVYLQQHGALDLATSEFVFELRKDMNGIARTLVRFVNTHTATLPSHETIGIFKAELDLIASLLLRRLRLEETRLYSLYRPA